MVPHPVRPETLLNLIRRQHLRIDQVVQTHLLKELLVLRQQVLVVIDTRQRPFGTQTVRNQTGRHVLRLVRGHRNKQIASVHAHLTQIMNRRRITYLRQHIVVGTQIAQPVLILIQQADLHVFATQQFSQVRAYFTGTCNNDSHKPSLSNFNK